LTPPRRLRAATLPLKGEGGGGAQGTAYGFQHASSIVQHDFVAEAQHSQLASGKVIVAFPVVFHLILVNYSVNLNREPTGGTVEIHDVWPDRLLTPKVVPIQPMRPKRLPQMLLRTSLPSA
jgi:hypothetical protein